MSLQASGGSAGHPQNFVESRDGGAQLWPALGQFGWPKTAFITFLWLWRDGRRQGTVSWKSVLGCRQILTVSIPRPVPVNRVSGLAPISSRDLHPGIAPTASLTGQMCTLKTAQAWWLWDPDMTHLGPAWIAEELCLSPLLQSWADDNESQD